jgi:hypothetical protein
LNTAEKLEKLRESVHEGHETDDFTCEAVSYFRSKVADLKASHPVFREVGLSPYVESLNCPLEAVLQ